MLLLGWKEIFTTTDMAAFNKCLDLLALEHIRYQYTTDNGSGRLSSNLVWGASPMLSRGMNGQGGFYRVYVKKKDFDRAAFCLRKGQTR